jgi:FMN phosphatase YigB (HAD superfamily)
MAGLRAILFDIGGVLVRTEDVASREQLARRYGLERAGIDALVFGSPVAQAAERGECAVEAVWQSVQATLGLSAMELESFQAQFWAGDRLDAGLFRWLVGLRGAGVKVGLLTNSWWPDPLTMLAERYGLSLAWLRESLDVAISSAAQGAQKPDPRIYRAALAALGTPAEATLFVDDFQRNVDGARAVGMQALLFREPAGMIDAIRRRLEPNR